MLLTESNNSLAMKGYCSLSLTNSTMMSFHVYWRARPAQGCILLSYILNSWSTTQFQHRQAAIIPGEIGQLWPVRVEQTQQSVFAPGAAIILARIWNTRNIGRSWWFLRIKEILRLGGHNIFRSAYTLMAAGNWPRTSNNRNRGSCLQAPNMDEMA